MVPLEVLRVEASRCTKCPLCENRRNVVFGEGDPNARLMLLGEGPGDAEDRTGRPFVGKAGNLLDRAILDAGICREEVFISNTVKCRAADWSTGKPINRPPSVYEMETCRGWLEAQIKVIQPRVILCIGRSSAANLIRPNFKITRERGVVFQSEWAEAILATLHPSYIIRVSTSTFDGGYSLLVDDIKSAWNAAAEPSDNS